MLDILYLTKLGIFETMQTYDIECNWAMCAILLSDRVVWNSVKKLPDFFVFDEQTYEYISEHERNWGDKFAENESTTKQLEKYGYVKYATVTRKNGDNVTYIPIDPTPEHDVVLDKILLIHPDFRGFLFKVNTVAEAIQYVGSYVFATEEAPFGITDLTVQSNGEIIIANVKVEYKMY